MAYIGVSPSNGVRRVHTYTATASQTTFSGAGAEGTSLSYKDSNFVDVYQNGIKLGDADYTSTSGTSIVLAQGASVDDLVVVVVFDVFSVADTVSKADGGTFDGNVTMGGTLDVTGETTLNNHINVPDSVELKFGADADFKISHNGSKTKLEDTGTGNLEIRGTNIEFYSGDGGETLAKLTDDGAVELYNDNTKRFETQSDGCKTTGVHRIIANAANAYALHVQNDGSDYNRYGIAIQTGQDSPSTTNYLMGFQDGDGNAVGSITFSGSGQTSFNTSSDYRLKDNVTEDWNATTRLKELKPCRFNFKKYPNVTLDGFLAHEAQEVVPEAVAGEKDAVDDNGNPIYQGIDQSKLVPLLTKALQEQQATIEALTARITALESK